MSAIVDWLCDGKEYAIVRCQAKLRESLEDLVDKDLDTLRVRIAALEECIEARDALLDKALIWIEDGFKDRNGAEFAAIRRADEEAGRLEKERGE